MTSVRRKPKQARAIQTRENVLHAAGVKFAAGGYSATTVAAVAKEANVALGTLLFHFPYKTDLGIAVYEKRDELVREILDRPTEPGPPGVEETFTRLAELFASNVIVRAGWRLNFESPAELDLAPADLYLTLFNHTREQLEAAQRQGIIGADVAVDALARTLGEAFTGAAHVSAASSDGGDLPSRMARMLPVLLGNGLDAK